MRDDHYRQLLEFLRTICGLTKINIGLLSSIGLPSSSEPCLGPRVSSRRGAHVGRERCSLAVEIRSPAVVAHRGSRVGVPSGDLGVAQVDAGVQHGGAVRLAKKHARVHQVTPTFGYLDPRVFIRVYSSLWPNHAQRRGSEGRRVADRSRNTGRSIRRAAAPRAGRRSPGAPAASARTGTAARSCLVRQRGDDQDVGHPRVGSNRLPGAVSPISTSRRGVSTYSSGQAHLP